MSIGLGYRQCHICLRTYTYEDAAWHQGCGDYSKAKIYRQILETIGHFPECNFYYGGCVCLDKCIKMIDDILERKINV